MTVHFRSSIDGPNLRGMPIVTEPEAGARIGMNRIGAEWEAGRTGKFLKIDSPSSGQSLGYIALSTRADIGRAVAAAEAARAKFGKMGVFERAALCMKIADEIDRRTEELARLLCLEQGKPFHSEAKAEVGGAALGFRNAAEQMKWLETAAFPVADANKRAFSFLQPKGVFAIITPWNFPLGLPCMYYLGPAVATGNTVVWVPAPTTSLIAVALMECLIEAGLPDGVINLVLGDGVEVGDEAVVHPGTHAIGFTGSSATGATIARRGAGKPLLLEMGGNGPTIVLPDADVEMAAAQIGAGCFRNAGQICTATERILVHKSVHDRFVEGLVNAAGKVRMGDPFDPATTMGPINNAVALDKMLSHMEDAVARKADVVMGGKVATGLPTNLYFEPTVVTGLAPESLLNTEESFGPVAPVLTFETDEEALELAASSPYGLSAAVFTNTIRKAFFFTERLRVGIVNVNEMSCYWEPHIPAGGAAGTQSGLGRTGGRHTLMEMCDLKTMTIDITR
ncbi:aldehyde dehydrogenase family protein [Mesorhizobium sp. BAC0120]|uniref:aldehyde dehydrogenase family protein n=1 Tax=Mesorhizobium sp. BAC0120 TaxID=3090670 RepID=UPI00298CE222|nr:aldehyde dehydrogenase family protein [Mesorhizobium sp. BAC0120]MDW6025091.1 aldehyde dehydrogenase family protein [Mesorhizobium sp. BAC0120]